VREKLIEELVKEVFGPRNGSEERLQGDPVKEYLTGVIIPKGYMAEDTEPDSEITIPAGENLNEDDTSTGETAFSAAPSELDPKMRAKSFGLSFLLRGKNPSFTVCVTWGRYKRAGEKLWQRTPRYVKQQIYPVEGKPVNLVLDKDENSAGGLMLSVRSSRQDEEHTLVVMYLTNEINVKKEDYRYLASKCIFQPSIRVRLSEETELAPFPPFDQKDIIYDFLYRNRPVLARGFMCSAVWKDIEPPQGYLDDAVVWADGRYFKEDCAMFVKPDVKSEFIPLYPDPAPSFEWLQEAGKKKPEFSAERLSEMWEKDKVENISDLSRKDMKCGSHRTKFHS